MPPHRVGNAGPQSPLGDDEGRGLATSAIALTVEGMDNDANTSPCRAAKHGQPTRAGC